MSHGSGQGFVEVYNIQEMLTIHNPGTLVPGFTIQLSACLMMS